MSLWSLLKNAPPALLLPSLDPTHTLIVLYVTLLHMEKQNKVYITTKISN